MLKKLKETTSLQIHSLNAFSLVTPDGDTPVSVIAYQTLNLKFSAYMRLEQLKKLLKQKENIRLEFKESGHSLPSNLFESICSMLNREGGDILLGVDDNGQPLGVGSDYANELISQIVNQSNNQQKLDPPFILFPRVFDIDGKKIIHIQIPVSS